MDTLKNWIGLSVEEGIRVGLQWKEQTTIDAAVASTFICEEDGPTLRVRRLNERSRRVQVIKFLTFEDPFQAILSDSYTFVQATIAPAAAKNFITQQQRPLTNETRGSLLNIKKYEILIEARNRGTTCVSIQVQDFAHLGCDGQGTFGHPRNVESCEPVRTFLQKFDNQTSKAKSPAMSDDDSLDVESPVRSQIDEMSEVDAGDVAEGQTITQIGFSTQLPGKTHNKSLVDRKTFLLTGLRKSTNSNLASKKPGRTPRPEDLLGLLGKAGTDGKEQVKEQVKERKKSRSIDVTKKNMDRESDKSTIERVVGEEDVFMAPNPSETQHAEQASSTRHKKAKREETFKPTAAANAKNEGASATAESAVRTHKRHSALSPQRSRSIKVKASTATNEAMKIGNEGGNDKLISSTGVTKVLDREEQNAESDDDPWKGMTSILQRDVMISKEQQTLLDRQDCWIPPEPGRQGPIANVPLNILQTLDALVDRRKQDKVLAQQEPELPEASQDTGIPSPTNSDETSSSDDKSETQLEWSTSPTPPLRALPPNSSSPGSPSSAVKTAHQSVVPEIVNKHVKSPSLASDVSLSAHNASSPPSYEQSHYLEVDMSEGEEFTSTLNYVKRSAQGTQKRATREVLSDITRARIQANVTSSASAALNQHTPPVAKRTDPQLVEKDYNELGSPSQHQLGTDHDADEAQSETENVPFMVEVDSSKSKVTATTKGPLTNVAPSTAPSKDSPTVQVKRTPHLSGETAKVKSVRPIDVVTSHSSPISERVGLASDDDDDGLSLDSSLNRVIPGTYNKPATATKQGKMGFGGDGSQDSEAPDYEDAMVDQQIRAEIDAYSQRSLSQSPSKTALSANEKSESMRSRQDRSIDALQQPTSASRTAISISSEFSHFKSSESKRKASDVGYLSPNVTKRRKFKAPPFNFSQENRQNQDPSRMGQRYRREFMSGLSSSDTRSVASDELTTVNDSAKSEHAHDQMTSSNIDNTKQCAEKPEAHDSVGPLNFEETKEKHLPELGNTLGTLEAAQGDRSSAGQHGDASRGLKSSTPQKLGTASFIARDTVDTQPRPGSGDSVTAQFKAAYPEYTGGYSHFRTMCSRIAKLLTEDRMEHRSLWDDFVIRHWSDYKEYVIERTEGGEDSLPYEKFYRELIDEPKYTKRVLSPITLKEVLHEVETVNGPQSRTHDALKGRRETALPPVAKTGNAVQPLASTPKVIPTVSEKAEIYGSRQHQSSPVSTDIRKGNDKAISPRQLPWTTPHSQSRGSPKSQARSLGAPKGERIGVKVIDEVPQKKGLKSYGNSPDLRKLHPRTPGSTDAARPADEASRARLLRKSINPVSPRVRITPAAKPDSLGKSSTLLRQQQSPAGSGSDMSIRATSSMATWLDKNKASLPPDQTEVRSDELWWKDKHTDFKDFARAYVRLKSVDGALGTVDEENVVRAKPRRFEVLNWSL
ncbi:MAG: hypothetical protein M1812_006072 [Candelaria pacifica]|nr:MAG: hypothetical protein M1812_006072 [Candelaria pacifica]